jgi:hypothetical protein
LRPGGAFVVEAYVPTSDPPPSGIDVRQVGPDRVVLSVFRLEGESVTGSLVSLSNGDVRLCPWSLRPTSPSELDEMAAGAGFAVESRHEGWRHEPFTSDSSRHVTVLRRAGGTVGTRHE